MSARPVAGRPTSTPVVTSMSDYSRLLDDERLRGERIGVVLTMGALHDGHASLIRRAASECDRVAVSVFVNPTQFTELNDLLSYPRSLDDDVALAAAAGADVVVAPRVDDLYPGWPEDAGTTVVVHDLARRWEGESRPGHFDGMATVVTKLLSASGRCRTYFGLKDFQQLAIVRQVVTDLLLPVDVIGCPTEREADGLARSSRNGRLSVEDRVAGLCLWKALGAGREALAAGASAQDVDTAMAAVVAAEPRAVLEYAALVDAVTLDPLAEESSDGPIPAERAVRLLVAATVGGVRLIDNCGRSDDR